VPILVKAGVLDGARPLFIPPKGPGRKGHARLRSMQRKERGEVVVDHSLWCVSQGPCGFAGPWQLGSC
jgi:hypothetical protein